MSFLTRKFSAHRMLSGLGDAIRLSGLPLDLIILREVVMPAWARGLTGAVVKKTGLFLVHLGLALDVMRLPRGRDAIVREFLLLPTLAVWPLVWFWRRRLWFLVHHNFDTARSSLSQRLAFRMLVGTGLRIICFETDDAVRTLRLPAKPRHVATLPLPLSDRATREVRPGQRAILGIVGNFRPEKGATDLLQQLTAAARLGVIDAQLLLGTSNADVRAEFAAQGWETVDTARDEDYQAALSRCDVITFNYARDRYYYRPSGVIADAVTAGVVVVAPDYPMLRSQVTQPARVGVLFDSPAALMPAVQEALKLAAIRPHAAFAEHRRQRGPDRLALELRTLFQPMTESPFIQPAAPAPEGNRSRVDLTRSVTVWPAGLKWRRTVWQLLIKPLFMLLPRPASKLRITLLRWMGAKIGVGCRIEPRVNVLMPWNLEMVNHVALGREVEIYNYAPVKIGAMTLISQRTYLCTGTHDYTHPHMPLTWAPITIGSECWVAADAFIGPGVKIGDGSVIGARSVVTKDLPPWMVCAGNPCRPLKVRELRGADSAPKPPRS